MSFFKIISRLIIGLAYAAGISTILMMGVTVVDVILRIFHISITGAFDLVRAFGVISVACALPYVTATKGHIAIEFFYHKSGRLGRLVLDLVFRVTALVLFALLGYHTFRHGITLFRSGEVFANLGIPVFWIPFVISFNCLLMMIVFVYHLFHPGKEYIKP